MRQLFVALTGAAFASVAHTALAQAPHVPSEGADVILGEVDNAQVYARADGIAALTFSTTSCNAGNKILAWRSLPNNKHPVIAMNLYRLRDGRMQQVGQSWVKHGFFALQQNICGFGCQENPGGDGLGPGCSDPYGVGNNKGPSLGSRREVNAVTGFFNGATANKHNHPHPKGTEHGLQVRESDLANPNSRYFIEGQYIHPDDSAAGNGLNNVSYREVKIEANPLGGWNFINVDFRSVRMLPAIRAWKDADSLETAVDTVEAVEQGKEYKSRIIVASKVIQVAPARYRYEYAVYNMNSERSVGSFSVPVGSAKVVDGSPGFYAVFSHGEPTSNDAWPSKVQDGRLVWSTKRFDEDSNANAIRWGTTYNFWFEAEAAPTDGRATVGWFKPGNGGAEATDIQIHAPAN